jgi:hypothetical protein
MHQNNRKTGSNSTFSTTDGYIAIFDLCFKAAMPDAFSKVIVINVPRSMAFATQPKGTR